MLGYPWISLRSVLLLNAIQKDHAKKEKNWLLPYRTANMHSTRPFSTHQGWILESKAWGTCEEKDCFLDWRFVLATGCSTAWNMASAISYNFTPEFASYWLKHGVCNCSLQKSKQIMSDPAILWERSLAFAPWDSTWFEAKAFTQFSRVWKLKSRAMTSPGSSRPRLQVPPISAAASAVFCRDGQSAGLHSDGTLSIQTCIPSLSEPRWNSCAKLMKEKAADEPLIKLTRGASLSIRKSPSVCKTD